MGTEAPRVQIRTSLGTFEVELYSKHCPKTCKNFLELSRKGYYNDTVVSTHVVHLATSAEQVHAMEGPRSLPLVTRKEHRHTVSVATCAVQ